MSNRFLIEHNGKGRLIEIPRGTPSDEYGRIQTAFATEAGGAPREYADLWFAPEDVRFVKFKENK